MKFKKNLFFIWITCLLSVFLSGKICAESIENTEKNDSKPKVSIVVPVYNSEKWLPECVNSLRNQTLKDIEIIFVDDGSTDNCGKILDEYAKQDPRIKVIHQENCGIPGARNSGLEIATGEYVTFVDSDDYLELNAYEVAYNYAEKDDVDVLRFDHRNFKDGRDTNKNKIDLSDTSVLTFEEYVNGKKMINYVWDSIFKNKMIKENNIKFVPGIKPADDSCFTYMALGYAKTIKSIPAKFYNYRLRPDSVAHTMGREEPEEMFIQSYKLIKCVCDSWHNGENLKNNEHNLLTLLVKWIKLASYKNIHLDYAQEILDSFGEDVYNPETVKKCKKSVQDELKKLELATKKARSENKNNLKNRRRVL